MRMIKYTGLGVHLLTVYRARCTFTYFVCAVVSAEGFHFSAFHFISVLYYANGFLCYHRFILTLAAVWMLLSLIGNIIRMFSLQLLEENTFIASLNPSIHNYTTLSP